MVGFCLCPGRGVGSPPSRTPATCSDPRRAARWASAVRMASSSPPSDVESLDGVMELVQTIKADALESLEKASSLEDVESIRVAVLGKKGTLSAILKKVGKLPKEDRPKLGTIVNEAKQELESLIPQLKEKIEDEVLERQMASEWVDVTQPGLGYHPPVGCRHPIAATIERTTEIFAEIGYQIIDDPVQSPEIETDWYNFEALNTPPDHPAREMMDTFYLKEDKTMLLRTQTSSVQIRYMEKNKPPFRICAPGRVYRRDTVDSTHSALFHQIEILNLQKKGELHLGHLKGTVTYFLQQVFGKDAKVRYRGSYFPFTEPSLEVDVYFRGRWLEVLGCGMVDPRVLEQVGVDPNEWSGFAAGFGVERFAMVIHEIPDIRELYKNDLRFLSQFPGLNR